ncbi:diacylglycerol kinase family protein [Sulfurovum sp.]|uniref:diacylglycerol kinase family protein n=1 Tax=Sulfurovum sp. TaxID=1969726 RepID=UPI00286809C7|nr:diacylglycerol kinase family protein [Sulfurovum sp.]
MHILSIGKAFTYDALNIINISPQEFPLHKELDRYDYIIISGGDGSIRRVLKQIHTLKKCPKIILNPTGSFNVIAKLHRVPKVANVLQTLAEQNVPNTNPQKLYRLNDEIFLFSAGNMSDLQHIFLAETLRFGFLQNNMIKYILSVLFLLPLHLVMIPFMLLSSQRFFIFTPASFIKKFGSFYGEVKEIQIDLKNGYNIIELDGDIVTVEESVLNIGSAGSVEIVS